MRKKSLKDRVSPRPLAYTLFPSRIGPIGMAATPKGLCCLSLNVRNESAFRKNLQRTYRRRAIRSDDHFQNLVAKLRDYLTGKPVRFKTRVDLSEGTSFQRRVWKALRRIPYGKTRSYQSVAHSIGHPRSFRAVGGACGLNPVAVLIPCHRVISSNGKLGGFSGGIPIKRRLLLSEAKYFRTRKTP